MFSNILLTHGYFCASHPWEIIVTTLTITICSLSMAIYMGSDKICDWNYKCPELDEKSSDIIILTFTKCVAIFYIYLQFKKLRKLGSKYILGLAGLFTIFSSFVISATAIHFLNIDLAFIKESIPFFLLLIDLSKASTLGKFSLNYSSYEHNPINNNKEINGDWVNHQAQLAKESIAKGMAILGPSFTLDTLVELMVVGIGTMSGIKTLEIACLFGCISIMANYFIFMTFYPACLSLVLEMSITSVYREQKVKNGSLDKCQSNLLAKTSSIYNPKQSLSPSKSSSAKSKLKFRPLLDDSNFWRISFSTGEECETEINTGQPSVNADVEFNSVKSPNNKSHSYSGNRGGASMVNINSGSSNILIGNPVLQRIKIIMSLGLLVVHIHSRLMVEKTGRKYVQFAPTTLDAKNLAEPGSFLAHQNPLWLFYLVRLFDLKIQDWVTILFALLTTLHYLYSDVVPRRGDESLEPDCKNPSDSNINLQDDYLLKEEEPKQPIIKNESKGSIVESKPDGSEKAATFYLGDDSEAPLGALVEDKETQTDFYIQLSSHGADKSAGDTEEDDNKLVRLLLDKKIASHTLDIHTGGDCLQSVRVRRKALNALLLRKRLCKGSEPIASKVDEGTKCSAPSSDPLKGLPYAEYPDYDLVNGACCENVIGYLPIPLGFAGPLVLDGKHYYLPMATTEGCLVASTNRGCRAIEQSGIGVVSSVYNNGMTRGPVVRLPSSHRAVQIKRWLEVGTNYEACKLEFETTSRFLALISIQSTVAGRLLYLRFRALTGDAMGMNMTSKACDATLKYMANVHPDLEILSLSGNYCTDKKVAAINWIEGRGKSVVCEAIIPQDTIKKTLKTTVEAMVELNNNKNLIGSAMAGSIGGFNAHAANIVASMFIATGQDPAQVVTSANCITIMEYAGLDNQDLRISCTMPSLETGTIGGGTILSAQKSCLKMIGVDGPNVNNPGENSIKLATIICGAVLAGELSLMAALSAGHLVKSHLKYNRSQKNCASS